MKSRPPPFPPPQPRETRSSQLNLSLKPSEHEDLIFVARELCLDKSNTIRFLVQEKKRALISQGARPPRTDS